MSAAIGQVWTRDGFFAWAEGQGGRYEFDGERPVAMTGGTAGHALVTRALHRALDARLRQGPCQPLGPDAGVETVNGAVRYPDAMVTSSPFELADRTIPGVIVIFEVLSPTSGRVDRIVKTREYAAIPSVRRYVILESGSIGATVLERHLPAEAWRIGVLTRDDVLSMPELGIEIPVAELYEGISFPADADGS